MDLAAALGQGGRFERAPSDVKRENLSYFLGGWRRVLERHPAAGADPSFLSFLSEQQACRLHDMGKHQKLAKGHRLFARGDRAGSFGLILQGRIIMSEMQDLRIRPQTTASRGGTRGGASTEAGEVRVLQEGDTFGEIPLAMDGQLLAGKREATLHAADDDVDLMIFTIDYKKFAALMQELPSSRFAPLAVASRLLPKVLPMSQSDAPWLCNTRSIRGGDGASVEVSEDYSPAKKKSKVLDSPPVTMVNMDVMMQCAWMAKRAEGIVSDTTRAIVGNETRMPHTVTFYEGEMSHWYFGWLSGLKRRSKENLNSWQMIEDFCKGSDSGQIVAIMTCCKRGNSMGKEHAQCRLLDRRKLETVLSGAKSNRLTGYIQKYSRVEALASAREYVLQCCWANNSFTVDWVDESMVECLTHVHRPARMDPGGLKKLNEKMNIKYHKYVAGSLSTLGDHFNSQTIKMNPLEQLDGRSKARARQFNDGTDAKAGNLVERDIRDSVKTACQQIAATFDKIINKSNLARTKAIADSDEFNLNHSPAFTLIRSMNCFFKINRDGLPSLLHCTAAVAHSDAKQHLTPVARAELLSPSEECFLYFAGYGADNSRLSGMGERAVLLDFSEFLQLLTKKDLLYVQVSITDASICFKHACHSNNAEEGQLKYPGYCACMYALRDRMGLNEEGKPKHQVQIKRASSVVDSDVVALDQVDIDARLAGVMGVRRQQDLERGRLGGMFAASMVEKMAIQDVQRRAAERDRKHDARATDLRRRVAAQAAADRKASEEHRKKAQDQSSKRQLEAEENAQKNWDKVQRTNLAITQAKQTKSKTRQAETEIRRQASIENLKLRRLAEDHRISEVSKRSDLLEQHRSRVSIKQRAVQDSTNEYKHIAVREKEVVKDMFHEYVRTGHLAKGAQFPDLSGDALPAVIEIATHKSLGHAAKSSFDARDQPSSLLSVLPEKGRTRHRSHSSFD